MHTVCMFKVAAVLALSTVAVALVVSSASGHDNPCHKQHTCPSDDHGYTWNGMSCTSDTTMRLPEDQLPVDVDGVRFWCHIVVDGGMTPNPGQGKPPATANCGGDRLTALAVVVPLAPANESGLAELASLQRPATISGSASGVTRRRYTVSGSLVSVRSSARGMVVVLGNKKGNRLTAVIPAPACAAGGTPRIAAGVMVARSKLRSACGAVASGTTALRGMATISGLGAWRPRSASSSGFELNAVTSFLSPGCSRRS
jgi:hypothetical protein